MEQLLKYENIQYKHNIGRFLIAFNYETCTKLYLSTWNTTVVGPYLWNDINIMAYSYRVDENIKSLGVQIGKAKFCCKESYEIIDKGIYLSSVCTCVYVCTYMCILIPIQSHELLDLECDYYRGGSKGVFGVWRPPPVCVLF